MAINLSRNQQSLVLAWKEVLDESSGINWALFGYEGQTYVLKFVKKGGGGLEELIEEFNSGKIMYAFCKIVDQKTKLPKFVLIIWQGEGAPSMKKGICANHVHDVESFFKGAHLTITARTDDDIEIDSIMERLSKVVGSGVTLTERSDAEDDIKPIGSRYNRVIPAMEIDSKERDKFWEAAEREEKERQEEQRKRKEVERMKLEEEIRKRETEEARQREQRVKERSKSICEIRESEKLANASRLSKLESERWDKTLKEDKQEQEERRARDEMIKRQRSEEAHQLISQRTIDARAIFEQNASAGQLANKRRSSASAAIISSTNQPSKTTAPAQNNTSKVNGFGSATSPNEDGRQGVITGVKSLSNRMDSINEMSNHVNSLPPINNELTNGKVDVPSNNAAVVRDQNRLNSSENRTDVLLNNLKIEEKLLKEPSIDHDEQREEQDWTSPSLEADPIIHDPIGAVLRQEGHGEPRTIPDELTTAQLLKEVESSNEIMSNIRARALYDYQAADETEISFDPNDLITHIEQIDEGWWQGMSPNGTYGLFPANYVELIN